MSVTYLRNREMTEDLDYILDPQLANQAQVEEKLQAAIDAAALANRYASECVNNKAAQFAVGAARPPLFQESAAVLWAGKNLVVYAGSGRWRGLALPVGKSTSATPSRPEEREQRGAGGPARGDAPEGRWRESFIVWARGCSSRCRPSDGVIWAREQTGCGRAVGVESEMRLVK